MATLYLGSKFNKTKMKKLLSEDQYLILRLTVKPSETYAAFFGDNGNFAVARARVNAGPENFLFEVLDVFFTSLGEFADSVENVLDGAFKWAK